MEFAVQQNTLRKQSVKIAISHNKITIRNQHLAIKAEIMARSILMELARL